jgi:hypothetical protein
MVEALRNEMRHSRQEAEALLPALCIAYCPRDCLLGIPVAMISFSVESPRDTGAPRIDSAEKGQEFRHIPAEEQIGGPELRRKRRAAGRVWRVREAGAPPLLFFIVHSSI